MFTDFGPASISKKSTKKILDRIKSKYIHRRTTVELADLSKELVAHVRGWINHYGKIDMRILQPVMKNINDRLIRWVINRYKRFNRSAWQARQWLREVYRDYPNMFLHWQYGVKP